MSDFLEEYGWLIQSIIGGSIGVRLIFAYVISDSGKFSELLNSIMRGLM